MHCMGKTLGGNVLLARLHQASPAGWGEAVAARRRAEEFGREEKEDSTLAATHLWLLGSSTWPIYKHVDFSS